MSVRNRIAQFAEIIHADKKMFFSTNFNNPDFLQGFHKVEMDHLINLAVKYPFLNIHWLFTGKGDMIITSGNKNNGNNLKMHMTCSQHCDVDGLSFFQ